MSWLKTLLYKESIHHRNKKNAFLIFDHLKTSSAHLIRERAVKKTVDSESFWINSWPSAISRSQKRRNMQVFDLLLVMISPTVI